MITLSSPHGVVAPVLVGLALLTAVGTARAAPVGAGVVTRHVLVVGVNHSLDSTLPDLVYADDDAARYAEALRPGATSLHLLAVLDADTQGRFPALRAVARPPTRAGLEQTVAEVFAAMRQETAAGQQPELVFVYTGHGAVDERGQGYVALLDGRLTRGDLFGVVIRPSPARFNHMIIDACSAYNLLNRGPEAVQAVRTLLDAETLAAHPNTGALLATSRDRATHEWARIGGGVFSHEILSALNGAADVDGDGAVRYDEIGAFIEAANEAVRDRRARIDLYLRPPSLDLEHTLWQPHPGEAPRLVLETDDTGHFAVADARGVPVAELHKNREQALAIVLRGQAPFSVTRGEEQWVTGPDAVGDLALATLAVDSDTSTPRSAIAASLERGLYRVPFGQSYVRGYAARLRRDQVDASAADAQASASASRALYRWWGVGALVGAGVSAALAVASFSFAGVEVAALQADDGAQAVALGQLITAGLFTGSLLTACAVLGAVAGGGLLLSADASDPQPAE